MRTTAAAPAARDAERLRFLVLAAQREGNRILTEALRPLGVTPSQAEVLRVLADYGPMTLKDLGAHLVCETGSPSRLLATLIDAGLVGREAHPQDGRAVMLNLTDTGADVSDRIGTGEQDLYDDIDRRRADLDMAAALRVLDALVADRPTGVALERRGLRPQHG